MPVAFAYQRVTDDASDVAAQARQLSDNMNTYLVTLNRLIGLPGTGEDETPLDRSTLRSVAGSWRLLSNEIDARANGGPLPISELEFDDWTNRVDRLETEVQRLNFKMQNYPIADTFTNLRGSLATLRDNSNDTLSEKDAWGEPLE
jgi:hypothetical protein